MNLLPTLARVARVAATRRTCAVTVAPRYIYSAAAFRPSALAMAKSKKRNRFEEEEETANQDEEVDDLFGSMPVNEPIASNAKPRAPPVEAQAVQVDVRDLAAEAETYEAAVAEFTASLDPQLTLAGIGPKLLPLRTAIDNANTWQQLDNVLMLMRTYTRRWRPISANVVEAFATRACASGFPEIALNEYVVQSTSVLTFTPARLLAVQRALAVKLSGSDEEIRESARLPGVPEEKVELAEGHTEATGEATTAEPDALDVGKSSIVNRMFFVLALAHATPDARLYQLALEAHSTLAPTPARTQRAETLKEALAELENARRGASISASAGTTQMGQTRRTLPEVIRPQQQRSRA